jgi:hypothetical protein
VETERISRKTFESLPEYSCSLPTGAFVGKVWRRNDTAYHPDPAVRAVPEWLICEYVEKSPPDPNRLAIDVRKPLFVD